MISLLPVDYHSHQTWVKDAISVSLYVNEVKGGLASFPFSERLNSVIFYDCNFLDFMHFFFFFLRIAMFDSAEISLVGLPIPHLQINFDFFFLNSGSNLTSLRSLIMIVTLIFFENIDFLGFCFVLF